MQDALDGAGTSGVAAEIVCARYADQGWVTTAAHVPTEREITVSVDGQELVRLLCTPTRLNCLVLGFLYAEGIIAGLDDVALLRVCDAEAEVDVRLSTPARALPATRTRTSGCGGGTTFTTQGQPVESALVVEPAEVLALLQQLHARMELYRLSGGVHASALADRTTLLVVAEDIGRHNTLDKIQGECLLNGLPTTDRLLLSTGRISSEMLLKAARMRVPVVVSRHSPTESAVALARALGIALVGQARGSRLAVYAHPQRLGCAPA